MAAIRGSCLCGDVAWEVTGPLMRFDTYPPSVDAAVLPDLQRDTTVDGGMRGSCLCGAVTYVATGRVLRAQHCHCSRCRKARAAAHASNFFLPVGGVRFTAGEDRLRSYKLPGAKFLTQVFCEVCGSPMPRLDRERGIAVVPMGSLDGEPDVQPSRHIFVGSKAPWYEITDDLPQFAEMPPPA